MSKRGKWRKGTVPNSLFSTLDFSQNSEDIRKQVDQLVASLTEPVNEEEPAIARSWPAMSLENAERLLEAIKHKIVDVAMSDIAVTLDFCQQSGRGRKHQVSSLIKVNWTLDFNFDNVSIPLFEDIFNNPDYVGDEYNSKKNIAQGIIEELSSVVPDERLALIPSASQADQTPVVITTKSHQAQQATQAVAPKNQELAPTKAVSDPQSGKASVKKRLATTENENPVASEPTSHQTTHYQPAPSVRTHDSVPANHRSTVADTSRSQVTVAQFETSQLPVAAPEDATYVAYCLNERKKIFNKQLTQLGIRLNQDISRRKQLLQAAYERDTTKILATDRKKLAPDVDKLRADKLAVTVKVKEEKLKQLEASIDRDQQAEIARAQAQFEAEKRQAIERSQQKLAIETQKIAEKLATKSTQELNTSIKKLEQQAQDNLRAREASLNRQTLGAMQAAVTDWLAEGNKIIEDWVTAKSRELSEYEREVTREHREALEASASQKRAAMNWEKVHENETEVQSLKQRLQQVQNQNLELQQTSHTLTSENLDMKTKLADEKLAQGPASMTGSVSDTKQSDKLIDLYLAKQLGVSDDPKPEATSNPNRKGWGKIATIAILLVLLLSGGIGGTMYITHLQAEQTSKQQKSEQTMMRQNKAFSKQVTKLQGKIADQSSALQKAQAKQSSQAKVIQKQAQATRQMPTSSQATTSSANNSNQSQGGE